MPHLALATCDFPTFPPSNFPTFPLATFPPASNLRLSTSNSSLSPLRITLWGINYAPELTGIAPYNTMLAEWLAAQGHDVSVVSTFPYYPAWKKRAEDRGKFYRKEGVNGVTLYRVWHYVPEKVSAAKRMIHEASYVCLSWIRMLFLPRQDVVIVVSPPLPLGAAAWVYRLIRRTPYLFHVQDLQPDAAAGLGMLQEGKLIRALYKLEAFAYAKADRVSGISEGMPEAYTRKGVPAEKQVLFPNPVDLPEADALPQRGSFRAAQQIDSNTFLALYSGNLGVKQGLNQIIEAATLLQDDPQILFVICGDGATRGDLEKMVKTRALQNVRFLPLQPKENYHEMLADTDLALVTQQAGSGAAFFPSKLLTLLAHGRPVLAVADPDSVVTQTLQKNECGLVVPPSSPELFARSVKTARSEPEHLRNLSKNGRRYISQFETEKVFRKFEREIQSMVEPSLYNEKGIVH